MNANMKKCFLSTWNMDKQENTEEQICMHMNKMQTRECWLAHTKKRFTRMNTHDDGDSLGNDDELVHPICIKRENQST